MDGMIWGRGGGWRTSGSSRACMAVDVADPTSIVANLRVCLTGCRYRPPFVVQCPVGGGESALWTPSGDWPGSLHPPEQPSCDTCCVADIVMRALCVVAFFLA